MMLQFYKMTGTAHDFIMVDNRDRVLNHVLTRENIADLCARRFGVGADGLIAVEPAQGKARVRMRHFAADGAEAEQVCAEAARCFTAFVDFLMEGDLPEISFKTREGVVSGRMNADDTVTLQPAATMQLAADTLTGPALIVFCGEVIICEG